MNQVRFHFQFNQALDFDSAAVIWIGDSPPLPAVWQAVCNFPIGAKVFYWVGGRPYRAQVVSRMLTTGKQSLSAYAPNQWQVMLEVGIIRTSPAETHDLIGTRCSVTEINLLADNPVKPSAAIQRLLASSINRILSPVLVGE